MSLCVKKKVVCDTQNIEYAEFLQQKKLELIIVFDSFMFVTVTTMQKILCKIVNTNVTDFNVILQ